VDGLADFHFRFNFGESGGLEGFTDVFVTSDDVIFDERSDKLGSTRDVLEGFLLFLLKPVL